MEGLLPMGPTTSSFFTKGINNRAVSRTTPATLGLFINRRGKLIWVENRTSKEVLLSTVHIGELDVERKT